jgi:hypothetical protein
MRGPSQKDLVNEVVPRLRKSVHTVPIVGQRFTAGNMAWYAAKAARSGRRSYYAGRSDVMSPGCQIDGNARHEWLDDEIEMETGDIGTLHDVIAPPGYQGQEPDPAEEAARNLDWELFLASHPPRHRTAILVLVEGGTMREAGKRCGLKDSAALVLKRRIAADLIEFFGEEVIQRLLDGVRPGWESDLRMSRERHACHVANAADPARVAAR